MTALQPYPLYQLSFDECLARYQDIALSLSRRLIVDLRTRMDNREALCIWLGVFDAISLYLLTGVASMVSI